MRIYYTMEALGLRHHVRSALGVDAGAWNQVSHRVLHWRRELQDRYGIPAEGGLRACGLATGAGESPPACNCAEHPTTTPRQRAEVLAGGLRLIEDIAVVDTGGVSVVNVCLPKDEIPSYRQVSLDRLFNRVNATAAQAGGHALLIFGHGPEETVARLYHRLRNYNPVPSGPGAGSGGPNTRNLPIERVIGGPLFRDAEGRLPAPGGRPGGPRPALAGGVARWGNGRNQPPRRLRCPGPSPEPPGVQARSPGGGQAVNRQRKGGATRQGRTAYSVRPCLLCLRSVRHNFSPRFTPQTFPPRAAAGAAAPCGRPGRTVPPGSPDRGWRRSATA